MAAAIAAAIIYGAAYPATAVALRSFSPLAVAGLSCTLALAVVFGSRRRGPARPAVAAMNGPRLVRLVVLALLGGILFITGINLAVAIVGPTITGFVAPLYAIFGTLFAVPLLGEGPVDDACRVRLAMAGTALLAGAVPAGPRSLVSCSPSSRPRCSACTSCSLGAGASGTASTARS